MTKIASVKQVSEAVSVVRAENVFSVVRKCYGCGEIHAVALVGCDELPFCCDCLVANLLSGQGVRRPTFAEAQAARRAEVLARFAQESAEGFGV
jgi:urease accessory protein UreE